MVKVMGKIVHAPPHKLYNIELGKRKKTSLSLGNLEYNEGHNRF